METRLVFGTAADLEKKSSFLFITYCLSGGGAERALSLYANALAKRGHRVDIYSFEELENEYGLESSVRVYYAKKSRMTRHDGKLSKYVDDALAIRHLAKFKYDFVIPFCTEMVCTAFFGLLGKKETIVATERNHPIHGCNKWLKRAFRDFVYRRCSAVWVQNSIQYDYYSKRCICPVFENGNICKVPDSKWSLRSSGTVRRFMTAGRLADQKNQTLMIRAFAAISKQYPDSSLDIFGEGPNWDSLNDLIVESGLVGRVMIKGFSHNIKEEFLTHDAFLFSSNYEGMPNALVEAMLHGMPIVTTSFPGADCYVSDGDNSLVVPCGNIQAFSLALKKLMNNPTLASSLGAEARKTTIPKVDEGTLVDSLLKSLGGITR